MRPAEDSMSLDRRSAIGQGLRLGLGVAVATLPACRGAAVATPRDIPTQQLGLVPYNDPAAMIAWSRWLGRAEDHDLLYFNQTDWTALASSVDYIVGLGRGVLGQGRRVHWSVPVGGAGAYGGVVAGTQDALYDRIATTILKAYKSVPGRICIRLPWEFNLESQTLAARDAAGRWDAKLYVAAYRRIATLFRRASPRFYFDWCPNIGRGAIDPESCYPGDDLVDVVSVDVYYQARYDEQGQHDAGAGVFRYRRTQPFGLDWLTRFGARHGKLIGLSEWGVDDDRATAFMQGMIAWIAAQGPQLSHHNYWDRGDGGINARLSDGHLPTVGALYREAFGQSGAV